MKKKRERIQEYENQCTGFIIKSVARTFRKKNRIRKVELTPIILDKKYFQLERR